MVVESMKMETEIHAPVSGTVKEIPVKDGDQIVAGDTLAVVAASGSAPSAAAQPVVNSSPQSAAPKTPAPVQAAAAAPVTPAPSSPAASGGETVQLEAPLPGLVLRIIKNPGETVAKDEVVMVVESMKMETEMNSPATGIIKEIPVNQGDQISAGDLLAVIERS